MLIFRSVAGLPGTVGPLRDCGGFAPCFEDTTESAYSFPVTLPFWLCLLALLYYDEIGTTGVVCYTCFAASFLLPGFKSRGPVSLSAAAAPAASMTAMSVAGSIRAAAYWRAAAYSSRSSDARGSSVRGYGGAGFLAFRLPAIIYLSSSLYCWRKLPPRSFLFAIK